MTSSDAAAVLPANAALINGTNRFAVTLTSGGAQTVTASDITDGHSIGTSSEVMVNPGPVAGLQLLVPGETAAPGTITGKTVHADGPVGRDGVHRNGQRGGCELEPGKHQRYSQHQLERSLRCLAAHGGSGGGNPSFSVTAGLVGNLTLTASDVTDAVVAPSTSPAITVYGVAPLLQIQPMVAIHDSELTRALENSARFGRDAHRGSGRPATSGGRRTGTISSCPSRSRKRCARMARPLRWWGTRTSAAGACWPMVCRDNPIVISLACEAIRDDEIAQLTNYVAAGGFLLVGSSAFTRNTNGTTRGDFALANPMGVHMVSAGLTNWANNTFSKTLDHSLVADIPGRGAYLADAVSGGRDSWGISPSHILSGGHAVWQVQSSDAMVMRRGTRIRTCW